MNDVICKYNSRKKGCMKTKVVKVTTGKVKITTKTYRLTGEIKKKEVTVLKAKKMSETINSGALRKNKGIGGKALGWTN